MTFLTATVLLAFVLISGATLFGALVVSRRTRHQNDKRVALVIPGAETGIGLLRVEEQAQASKKFAERIRGFFAFGIARRWGMHASGVKLLLIAAVTGLSAWAIFLAGLHMSSWLSLLLASGALFLVPRKILQMQQNKAERKFMDQFPAAIDMIVRMLRVGMPVSAAIRSVGSEAPSPVDAVFKTLADEVEIGIAFEDALRNAGERIGLTDFRFFAVAISLQRTSGGNLVTTLETLSDIIRRRRATRMKAQSATAEVRMSTYVLASIPFFVIGGMALLSPAYLTPLIFDPRGNVIVAIAVGMLGFGFWTMRWMMNRATRI